MLTSFSLVLLICGVIPQTDNLVLTDKFDNITLHHFYDDNGKLVFDQVIFYDLGVIDYNRGDKIVTSNTLVVQGWRLYKWEQRPNLNSRSCTIIFKDGEVLRKVSAKTFTEQWSQIDPESIPEQRQNKHLRRELHTIKKFVIIKMPETCP
jgi:hypothetical protein